MSSKTPDHKKACVHTRSKITLCKPLCQNEKKNFFVYFLVSLRLSSRLFIE